MLEANATQGSFITLDHDFVSDNDASASATKQDPGRKDTAQPTRRQWQEGGLVQWDAGATYRGRAEQQHKRPTLDTKHLYLSRVIQLVRAADILADQDPGHRRRGSPIYHHFRVRLLLFPSAYRRTKRRAYW